MGGAHYHGSSKQQAESEHYCVYTRLTETP